MKRCLAAGILLVATTTAFAQSDAVTFRWVRGRVMSNTPGTIIVTLQGTRQLSVTCDARCDAASPGSLVELHYSDRKGQKRAEYVFVGPSADNELSRKPGRSVRGIVARTRKSSVQLQVGSKKRSYEIERKAAFVEAGQWQPAASGRAEVIARLVVGESVLLKYEEQDSSIYVGDVLLPQTTLKALEVRRLSR
jgi:hypothetical protein